MTGFELLASHRKVKHTIELDGYEDFDHQGYWVHSHLCRPQLLVITWIKDNDLPWELSLTLWVAWVRKDGTISSDKGLRKEIKVILQVHRSWANEIQALPWMIQLLEKFDQDYVPGADL